MEGPHQPERAATTDLPNQINYACMYVMSFDLVYFISDEDLIDIFTQHLFHDYPISCITTITMIILVPIDKSSKGTGVSSRIFN